MVCELYLNEDDTCICMCVYIHTYCDIDIHVPRDQPLLQPQSGIFAQITEKPVH